MREFLVEVQMTRLEESTLIDTVTVEAETEDEAIAMVESLGPIGIEDQEGWHGGWVYQCLYDQSFDSVEAECISEEE